MALTNRTLILFKYFWEATDEAHPVSLADISAQLKEHGITADPRTLRNDIEQLVEFGVDIVKDRRVQNLYHVATRHFEAPEVKLLIDAVQSARFITPGKSKELVKRLTTFVAPGDTALLERHLYIDSRVKAVNEGVYISVHCKSAHRGRRSFSGRKSEVVCRHNSQFNPERKIPRRRAAPEDLQHRLLIQSPPQKPRRSPAVLCRRGS